MLICALATIEPASSSITAASVTMIWWGVCMAALFTLQQERAIAVNSKQSDLALASTIMLCIWARRSERLPAEWFISRVSLTFLAPTCFDGNGIDLGKVSPKGLLWWQIRCVGEQSRCTVPELEIQTGNSGGAGDLRQLLERPKMCAKNRERD
jgi:hypothetical protein